MTDMEKKIMVRLCTKILTETDLCETDKEVHNLVDWVCVSEQIERGFEWQSIWGMAIVVPLKFGCE